MQLTRPLFYPTESQLTIMLSISKFLLVIAQADAFSAVLITSIIDQVTDLIIIIIIIKSF